MASIERDEPLPQRLFNDKPGKVLNGGERLVVEQSIGEESAEPLETRGESLWDIRREFGVGNHRLDILGLLVDSQAADKTECKGRLCRLGQFPLSPESSYHRSFRSIQFETRGRGLLIRWRWLSIIQFNPADRRPTCTTHPNQISHKHAITRKLVLLGEKRLELLRVTYS